MSNVLVELKYIDEYEWICIEVDGMLMVGIIDYVQSMFGDIVFFELFEVGKLVNVGDVVGVVELVKVVFDIYLLVFGEIVVINEVVIDVLEEVNGDVYGVWFFKIKFVVGVLIDKLIDVDVYSKLID